MGKTSAWGAMILIFFWGTCAVRGQDGAPEIPRANPVSLLAALRNQGALDFCGEAVPVNQTDPRDIRERLEKEMLLMLWDRPQVILWMKRARRFFPVIEQQLAARGLPTDLKYVAVVESALRPHVRSAKGATGYWQFLKSTGQKYGLRIDRQIDERRNIHASTRAAADYLTFLYKQFGSWSLAAAAYNMGEEGLKTAMLTQEVTSYYQLYLPLETQRYLFRIIAAKQILSDPRRYGFDLTAQDGYPPVAAEEIKVTLKERLPLRLIAQSAGIHFKRVKDLNPEIRGVTLVPGQYVLRLPPEGVPGFHQRLKINRAAWKATRGEQIYVVREGDNLSAIADRFDVPLPALLLWNRLRPDRPIHPGDRLTIYPPKPKKGG